MKCLLEFDLPAIAAEKKLKLVFAFVIIYLSIIKNSQFLPEITCSGDSIPKKNLKLGTILFVT